MGLFLNPLMIPIAAFVMVVAIVAITSFGKMREKELEAHREMRAREMEHERKMKELEVEKAKLEVERTRQPKAA
jgi:uncharacterized membrane protein